MAEGSSLLARSGVERGGVEYVGPELNRSGLGGVEEGVCLLSSISPMDEAPRSLRLTAQKCNDLLCLPRAQCLGGILKSIASLSELEIKC